MRRPDLTLLLALVIALGAHLLLLRAGENAVRKDLGWWLRGPRVAVLPDVAPAVQPADSTEQQIGEAGGLGRSINSSPGNVPMQAEYADAQQEQAMMSRDPSGFGPGRQSSSPNQQQSENTSQQKSAQTAQQNTEGNIFAAQESALATPTGPRSQQGRPKPSEGKSPQVAMAIPDVNAKPSDAAAAEDPMSAGPGVLKPPAKVDGGPPVPAESSKVSTPQQASPKGQQGASAAAPPTPTGTTGGTPMPSGEFESTPVVTIAADPQSGRIEARNGRKMITRWLPRLTLAAMGELMSLENPTITLRIKIDETGNVTDVRATRSSGSDDIDLPWIRAVNTWWFEPKKDPRTGKAVPDVMDLDIHFE